MIKFYYKLIHAHRKLEPGIYSTISIHKFDPARLLGLVNQYLMLLSEKVWVELDDGNVLVIKYRDMKSKEVDLEEFVWIKLSARTYNYTRG